ncbi:MAG TPA: hypothetical protein VFY13_03275 [Luteolibacter sp.]|nr:hypothetical protein [Luteolibacter sp.]
MSALIHTLARIHAPKPEGEEGSSYIDPWELHFPELIRNLVGDEESGLALFEKTEMPPIYHALKVQAAQREACAQRFAGYLGEFAGDFGELGVTPMEVNKAGSNFSGVKIEGAKFAAVLDDNRERVLEVMPESRLNALIATLKLKNMVILSGIHSDHIVLFMGASADDLVLVDQVEQSLAASSALDFADPHLDKPLVAILYANPQTFGTLAGNLKGSLKSLAAGLRDGLATSDLWGDTRNLESMLRMVEERETVMESLMLAEGGVAVAFIDQGLRVEACGGLDPGWFDWQEPSRLASLDRVGETVVFADFHIRPEGVAASRACLEALMESWHAMSLKLAEFPPPEDDELAQYKDDFRWVDQKLRGDLTKLWSGFNIAVDGGLGCEHALVLDLKGTLPDIKDLPPEQAAKIRVPRVAWVAPLRDRAKLASAWREMSPGVSGLAATLGESLELPVKLNQPMSKAGEGLMSWFHPLPCFNDGFLPSITLSDGWFAASTSDQQARDLLARAALGGGDGEGLRLRVDCKALEQYGRQTLELLEKPEDVAFNLLGSIDPELLKPYVESLGGLDQLTLHVRRESGVLRSSLHLSFR